MSGLEILTLYIGRSMQILATPLGFGTGVWFLAWIFMWSGYVKLRRPKLAVIAMIDFGAVKKFRPILGTLLGASEVSLAILLISSWMASYVLLTSALALWIFTLFILRSLIKGKKFACFCFGDTDSELSYKTLIRTGLLALLASTLWVIAGSVPGTKVTSSFLFAAVNALAILGTIVLLNSIQNLLTWNRRLSQPD